MHPFVYRVGDITLFHLIRNWKPTSLLNGSPKPMKNKAPIPPVKHGGNVYAASLSNERPISHIIDFSASINPLGIPPLVRRALLKAIPLSVHYPRSRWRGVAKADWAELSNRSGIYCDGQWIYGINFGPSFSFDDSTCPCDWSDFYGI